MTEATRSEASRLPGAPAGDPAARAPTRRRPSRALVAALLVLSPLALALGCPDTVPQLCPNGTRQESNFSVTLTQDTARAGECIVDQSPDGGPDDAGLAAPTEIFTAAICSSLGSDGGPLVWLALSTSYWFSAMDADGGFLWGSDSVVPVASCVCNLTISEQIRGWLQPAQADGGVVVWQNGGLTPLGSFSGTLVDSIDGGADCARKPAQGHCNVPCSLDYTLTATKL
jgi:hypothetical protein